MRLKTRGLWCGASDAGASDTDVRQFAEKTADAGFNLLLTEFKHGDGRISFQSDLHPECVRPDLGGYDLAGAMLAETRKTGQELHAWFIDYMEAPGSPANVAHPEWAAKDLAGNPTDSEMLRGRQYGARWMCPAREPGYTDQWLVPLYKEFAQKYAFDGVHHDYVRYPGDLAPDQYCFCDWCLEQIPLWAGLATRAFPQDRLSHPTYDREYVEAHWEPSPTVLPEDWPTLNRKEKATFLLEGSFFPTGRQDLDYFFYTYRIEAIERFVRACANAVRSARPEMKISGAFFKNPIHSGRFIGQDWRRFVPWVDDCFPMDYRDHFPGSFDDYLVLLKETVANQLVWSHGYGRFAAGTAINFLYYEEELPLLALAQAARFGDKGTAGGFWNLVSDGVRRCDPSLASEIEAWIGPSGLAQSLESARRYLSHRRAEWFSTTAGEPPGFAERLTRFSVQTPTGYWPKHKLGLVAEAALSAGSEGFVVFCYGHLDKYGLWETVKDIFKE